jgi:hypothetical protein
MERLYTRQQNQASKKDTAKAEQRESSQDGRQSLYKIPEESSHVVSTEQIHLSNDTEDKVNAEGVSEEAGDESYFDLRDDKFPPALSIIALLDSDSDRDSSEEDDAEVDSESDAEGSYGSTKS